MSRFVQLRCPSGDDHETLILVNPEHVVLVEPVAARGKALCRVWLAAPVGEPPARNWYRDVIGSYADILKRLDQGNGNADPLGTVRQGAGSLR